MAANRITFKLFPGAGDEHVRLQDFIHQLDSFRVALQKTERFLSGHESQVQYRIVGLRHNSPPVIVVEAFSPSENTPVQPQQVVSSFIGSIKQIRSAAKKKPKDKGQSVVSDRPCFDLATLEAYMDITSTLEKGISRIDIKNTKQRVTIDQGFKSEVVKMIGPDRKAMGSLSGRLEKINLHNAAQFHIYPAIGPSKVVCDFPCSLKDEVKKSLDEYVTVFGSVRYKKWSKFPYAIDVDRIQAHPPVKDLPTLESLRGINPGATGELSSEDFIRRLRDEWED